MNKIYSCLGFYSTDLFFIRSKHMEFLTWVAVNVVLVYLSIGAGLLYFMMRKLSKHIHENADEIPEGYLSKYCTRIVLKWPVILYELHKIRKVMKGIKDNGWGG